MNEEIGREFGTLGYDFFEDFKTSFDLPQDCPRWWFEMWGMLQIPIQSDKILQQLTLDGQNTCGCFQKKNSTPKSSHFNRVFHYFHHPFWGFSPYFWKHPCIFDRCCNSITGDHQIKLLSLDGCILGYCQLSVSI